MAPCPMPMLSHRSARGTGRFAIVPAAFVLALLCAIASVSRVSVLPPKIERRDFQVAGVVTHMLVDLKRSGITDRRMESPYFDRIDARADVVAHLMAEPPVLKYIARRAHIPMEQIAADAPVTIAANGPLTEPGSEMRAREILLARRPYRLEIQSTPSSPIVAIYAQAPSLAEAKALDAAAISGARDYFNDVAVRTGALPRFRGIDQSNPIEFTQLGPPRGAVLTGGIVSKVVALTFLLTFGLACAALRALVALRIRARRRTPNDRSAQLDGNAPPAPGRVAVTAAAAPPGAVVPWSAPVMDPTGTVALRRARPALTLPRVAAADGAWPRTTRVLPWMLAGFLAMLWLIPFDSLQLDVPSPIELRIDRLVLPVIVLTWVLALAVGGRGAPRLRATRIHVALGAFLTVAFLSVIVNVSWLSHTLELDTSVKKLPLLVSYASIFVVMASVVRRDEVAAFMKYILVLAVICALGMVYEKHHFHNVFFEWSESVLPSLFKVATIASTWDTEGRRMVHGPTIHPLVAAAMLSLALPIAVLGVIDARRTSRRVLYAVAGGVLVLGMLNTQRKTGLVAPVAVLLTLACFRRRELLRLAPAALVALVVVVIVHPGAVAPVVDQFSSRSLEHANTVSDRASDYDAIRPDVATHFALGRGFGSYQPVGHRILDSQVLVLLLEMGVLGVAAFFVLGGSVVMCARRTIHSRHPTFASPALVGATAGVLLLVLAVLFDSMAAPQVPYVFLCFAALVAVIVKPTDEEDREASRDTGGLADPGR